jgi:pyruvate kinase
VPAQPASITRARTKIVATVGPACDSCERLAELLKAGADVFRLNMAHGTIASHSETANRIRQVSRELNHPVAILVDLAGPKIRLGELAGGEIDCRAGETVRFIRGEAARGPNELCVTYSTLIDELSVGDRVMLVDGTVALKVEARDADGATCRVIQGGVVRNRQGVNLPGVKLSAPALGEADREHAQWAALNGIDFVSLSFVRRPDEVRELKALLKQHSSLAHVVAKIEKPEALENLEAIVAESDAVMVARGDLGVEIDVARMPVEQKRIIHTCRRMDRPVIVATQMLDSMRTSRVPTRAEVTDVANAILDGCDACMLSGETAIGSYPKESVEMMNRVAAATEELWAENPAVAPGGRPCENLHQVTLAMVRGVGAIARSLSAKLIVAATHSGRTALALSQQRNFVPTIGITDQEHVLRKMCLYWGVTPLAGVATRTDSELVQSIVAWGTSEGCLKSKDRIVLVCGTGLDAMGHNRLLVHEV